MTSVDQRRFSEAFQREKRLVDDRCRQLVEDLVRGPRVVKEAIEHTALDGGKRIRPILCLWTHDAVNGGNREACLDAACALEFLHTYTLVHDDLPCMDDDDLRRGKPSCHRRFGEAVAVLTGDALQTLCFETLAGMARRGAAAGTIVDALGIIAGAAGTRGLIAGQILDLAGEGTEGDVAAVEEIHRHKTAALISAAMETGAVVAGASPEDRERMRRAGLLAGEAFQIVDDILDVEMDAEALGKTPGKDAASGKLTYPAVAGMDASRHRADELVAAACAEVGGDKRAAKLLSLIEFIARRRS